MSYPSRSSHPHLTHDPNSSNSSSSSSSSSTSNCPASVSNQSPRRSNNQSRWAHTSNQQGARHGLTINTVSTAAARSTIPGKASSTRATAVSVLSPTASGSISAPVAGSSTRGGAGLEHQARGVGAASAQSVQGTASGTELASATAATSGLGLGLGLGLTREARQAPSRHSSASSISSAPLFSPTGSAPTLQSSRNSTTHLTSSTVLGSNSVGGSSRGASRFGREQSNRDTAASPTTATSQSTSTSTGTGTGSGSSKQIASVVKSQLNILLTQLASLKEDKDRNKWEAQVDKIKKVCVLSFVCLFPVLVG